jgi:thiol:disulfide interchange protein/DsbC/DsbD-like thiol-disulfide interchange protein
VRVRQAISGIFLALFAALSACAPALAQIAEVGNGGPGPVKAQHLTAELVSLGPAIAPGGAQELGLILTMQEKWHVYWINPGDSGEPPRIRWTLPHGITAGAMQFPVPERLPLGPLMDYGYEDEVAFPIQVEAAPNLKSGKVHLDAHVDWLVCSQVCIPGKAHLGLDLDVAPGAPSLASEKPVGALGEGMKTIPQPLPKGDTVEVRGGAKEFAITFRDGRREKDAEFYPFPDQGSSGLIANAADQDLEPLRDGLRLWVTRAPDLKTLPAAIHGVLRVGPDASFEFNVPVVPGEVARPGGAERFGGAIALMTGWSAIGLAFLGGILLNLMPCVFPVLFLKGLSLVQSSAMPAEERRRAHLLRHGLVYALGILVSFWVIVAVLLVLRAGGHHAGWGFQLQSPVFVAVLASFLFLFALSLAGQFDLGLSLTSAGGSLANRRGYAGSFFTGVLATVVATPCTAPLMGAAIGYALAKPAIVTFGVFTALAAGLAAPYLLLSIRPAWFRALPKPGPWMETLKQITAVPLFVTTIWLAWVYGQLYPPALGVSEIALLLACLLAVAVAGWALGRWPARWGSAIAAALLLVLGLAIPVSQARMAGRGDATASAASTGTGNPGKGLQWQPYSDAAISQAQAAGHPVFVDFTAAWCLSCQFNERAVLRSADVEKALREHSFVLLKADWTNEDPAITAKLASVNRAGVPTYVIYPGGPGGRADVLPELLTKDIVLGAIKRDGV